MISAVSSAPDTQPKLYLMDFLPHDVLSFVFRTIVAIGLFESGSVHDVLRFVVVPSSQSAFLSQVLYTMYLGLSSCHRRNQHFRVRFCTRCSSG